MIALEHSLSFSNGSWEPKLKTLSFHSKKGNEISIDDVWMDTSYVSCLLHEKKKWYDGINEEVSVEENVLVMVLHPINGSVYISSLAYN